MPNASVKLASEFGCTCACFGSGIDSQSVTYLCTSARVTHGVKTGLCQGIHGDLLALEGPLGAARGSVQRRMPPLELPAVESHSAGDAMLAHPWARNTALHVVGFDATAPDPLQLSPTSFTGWCWDAIKWMPHESAMVQGEEPAFQ
ncbi:hypothetical protein PCL_03463 [Purpureocillium lilacinum]|uniref:Uncharacterized protein n=1 Tax=Purpureocillium lilacinum TaxID=33203 RepID=A0A2U3EP40_PURLI|nr:hypothetical protein Purlil1_4988 [Purpureocillium lilacinum]PWI76269.1 hypothetical protein PCL_03463 [Purpureocillium lilacinum]